MKMIDILYWTAVVASAGVVTWFAVVAEGAGLMLYMWPITAILVVNLIVACATAASRLRRKNVRNLRYSLLPLLATGAIIAYALANENVSPPARPQAGAPIAILLAAQLLIVLVLTWRTPGFRWIMLSLGAFSLWLSYSAAFIAGMMVTGIWI